MSWVKITDTAFEDPRLDDLDAATVLLHFEALTYSSRNGLGGRIRHQTLRRVSRHPDPVEGAVALVAAGLWEVSDDAYQLIWLLADQPSPEEAEAQRVYDAARQRVRFARVGSKADDEVAALKELEQEARQALFAARERRKSHFVTHDVTHAVTHSAPSRPVPERGRERGPDAGALAPGGLGTTGTAAGPGRRRLCRALTVKRQPCTKFAMRGADFCVSHSALAIEAKAKATKEARRREREAARPTLSCPEPGCGFTTKNGGSLGSHRKAKHTPPLVCEEDGCDFSAPAGGNGPKRLRGHVAREHPRCHRHGCEAPVPVSGLLCEAHQADADAARAKAKEQDQRRLAAGLRPIR